MFERRTNLQEMPKEELEVLMTELKDIPEFQTYKKNPVQLEHLKHLAIAMEPMTESLPKKSGGDIPGIVTELIDDIETLVQRYGQAYRLFYRTSKQYGLIESADYRARMADADQSRIRTHDALIDALVILQRFVVQAVPSRLQPVLPAPQRRQLKSVTSDFQEHFFSPEDLDDKDNGTKREKVGAWAMMTDEGLKIDALLGSVREALDQKEKAEAV